MAEEIMEKDRSDASGDMEIRFKCRLCEQEKPLHEMRTVTRFIPALVVCRDCAKTLR